MLGFIESLFLVGAFIILIRMIRRFPSRRVSSKILFIGSFFAIGLAFFLFVRLRSDDRSLSPAMFGYFMMLGWGAFQLFRQAHADTRPAIGPSADLLKDLPAERLPPQEQARHLRRRLQSRFWGKCLPFLFRARRPSGLVLLLLAFGLGFLAFLVSDSATKPGHPLSALMYLLFFSSAFVLFIWAMVRFLGLPIPEAPLATCPPIDHLKDFLSDRLPSEERGRLAAHLDGCSFCQHRVEELTVGHNSWPGLARKLSERPAEPEPALQKLMARLKEEKDPQATRDEPVLSGDLPLGFLSPTDKPGQLGRLERYDVLEEIGRGGMGVVLKAFDPSLHRVVAIKVLAPQLATSGVARKRFLREAKAAAAVTHDHIVTIHAVDEANGLPYLVMQYVAGLSLQQRIDKDGPLELAEVLRIGMQTASALAAAHAHGIVHRDIKPANILLEEGVQRVKITDFGLARAMDDASLTQSGVVAGSPLYMAPEQARGEALDHRADLFSLGSVLYTMCTGRPPFRAPNTLAVLRRVSEESPRPIRETNPEVPDWLAAVVEKLMAKDPADRFPSAADVVEVLGQHLAQLQDAAWVPPPRSPAPVGANAGLPTSVTICPSCGANLHVPERMVGTIVHCAECGKPFHVEEGSEVIQVARAVNPPFGPRRRTWRKLPGCVWIAAGCVTLFFFLILVYAAMRDSQSYPVQATLVMESLKPTFDSSPNWRNELQGLPAEATWFGAIDLRAFGSLTLEDAPMQALLRLAVPKETADRLTTENLGRIRIDGVALGYYEGPKTENPRAIVHLDGLALDGRKRIVETVRQTATEQLQVEEKQFKGVSGKSALISGDSLPFALGIYDDQHAFLTYYLNRDAKEAQHRKVLEQMPWFDASKGQWTSTNILSGYNPPWIQDALAKVPGDACGLLIGEIPAELRKYLTDALGLRVRPRSFFCQLKREGQGVALSLTLNLDKPGTDQILRDDLEKWRRQGIDSWQTKWPAIRKEQQALASLKQTLTTMRWTADRGTVRTQVHVSADTWKTLCAVLKRASE